MSVSPHVIMLCALLAASLFATTGCQRETQAVIVITATFLPPTVTAPASMPTSLPTSTPAVAAPTPTPVADEVVVVQPGDTLVRIAQDYGVDVQTLLSLNAISDPNTLFVGQSLRLPALAITIGPANVLLPDSRLVRGPGSVAFDVQGFIDSQPGYVRLASDTINEVSLTATQIVQRVSLEFSVDARLLLAVLEYRAGWLSRTDVPETERAAPIGAPAYSSGVARSGLYLQLAWTADQLNNGFYGWRQERRQPLMLADQTRVRLSDDINAATAGIQVLFSQLSDAPGWERALAADGLMRTYRTLFGDPFIDALEPLVPAPLEQPPLKLPFADNETWYYTGGPHGGWGRGSAWAAVDFAPPDDLALVNSACYVSQYWVTAVADGVIARAGEGSVILDLDGDADESTGWTILYLHLASDGLIATGSTVRTGDRLGRPSCEGGFSNGTHLHIARRYNGEWIPADCESCSREPRPPFVMDTWAVDGLPEQEYQGFMRRPDRWIVAEQYRDVADNQVSSGEVPLR